MLEAIIFGVDGVLAETHEVRREAFNTAFTDGHIEWRWGRVLYAELLKICRGRDMVDAFIGSQFPHWRRTDDLSKFIAAINRRQSSICRQRFDSGSVPLRAGMLEFIQAAARAGVRMAVATEENESEVVSLLRTNFGSRADQYIKVVAARAPASEHRSRDMHARALAALALDPASCLAVESSAMGVRSAAEAGIPTVITTGLYPQLQDCSDLLAADGRSTYASSTIVSRWNSGHPSQLLAELRMAHAAKTAANDAFTVPLEDTKAVSTPEIAHARS